MCKKKILKEYNFLVHSIGLFTTTVFDYIKAGVIRIELFYVSRFLGLFNLVTVGDGAKPEQ